MFNFTTTTIINENVDASTPVVNGKPNPLIVVGTGKNGFAQDEVLIKRVGTFKKDNVLSIFENEQIDEKTAAATITAPTPVVGDIYRLVIEIGLTQSENSYYANDLVFKGKPLFIEAKATKDANTLAKDLVINAKKFITMVYEKELVHLHNTGLDTPAVPAALITVNAIDEHQVLRRIELQHWVPNKTNSFAGEWVAVATGKITEPGKVGFGTYKHLLHNYVLPTGANLRFGHILENETPKVGGKYTQFILRMCVDRGVMGGDAVGLAAKSITTHCFWVEAAAKSSFDAAVTALGGATEKLDGTKLATKENPIDDTAKEIAELKAKP